MADEAESVNPNFVNLEGNQEEGTLLTSTGAWLSDWWQSAKEKSSSALEFMKRDLTEFSQVVQSDTVSVVSNTTAILKEKLRVDDSSSVAGRAKQGFNDLLQTVSGALYPTREPDNDELVVIRDSEAVVLDNWQADLYQIQCDLSTFSHEPRGPPELYEKWLEGFDLQDKQQEITHLLRQCPEIQSIYTKLVPSSVSESEFWQRYYYRVWQLKESKRADLVRRAQPKSIEEEFPWDDDEELSSPTSTRLTSKTRLDSKLASLSCVKDGTTETKPTFTDNLEAERTLVKESGNPEAEDSHLLVKSGADSDSSNISAPSCDSSEKGTSDEWEKDFDLELNDPSFNIENAGSIVKAKEQDEDWENWE